jgi:hypothetical protein
MIGKKVSYVFVAVLMVVMLWAPAGWSALINYHLTITDLVVTIGSVSSTPTQGTNYVNINGRADSPVEQPSLGGPDNLIEAETTFTVPLSLSYTGGPWFTEISSSISYTGNVGTIELDAKGTAPDPFPTEYGTLGESAIASFLDLYFPDLTPGSVVKVTGSYTLDYELAQDLGSANSFEPAYFWAYARIEGDGWEDGFLIPYFEDYLFDSEKKNVSGTINYQFTVDENYEGPQTLTIKAFIEQDGRVSPVPVPGAVWLLGTGLLGLLAWRRSS